MKRLLPVIISAIMFLSGCSIPVSKNAEFSKNGFYFDTIISITIFGMSEEAATAAIDECFEYAKNAETLYSRTVPGSDIDLINKANGDTVWVTDGTVDMLNTALKYSEASDGRFAVTVGALTKLWDFSGADKPSVPYEEDIKKALSTIDDKKIKIDGNDISLSDPSAQIDLGAIAKGYIADNMRQILIDNGVESAIINLGGNVMLLGSHPDGSDFIVGIQEPFASDGTALTSVKASDISIVTSGTYQRYYEIDGRLYHHILDTKTGYPADTGLNSVTIIGTSSVDCDALSTACFLMGYDEASEYIESLEGYEAVFIDKDNNMEYTSGIMESEGRLVLTD